MFKLEETKVEAEEVYDSEAPKVAKRPSGVMGFVIRIEDTPEEFIQAIAKEINWQK